MSKRLVISIILLLMAASFLAGAWISYLKAGKASPAGGRKILYYVDPMHPSYRSDKPGTAPDCGMPLEPVYADGTVGDGSTSLPPGAVRVSPEKLQTIGIVTGTVEKSSGSQNLRLTGRVAPDESKVYVINATIDGWITAVGSNTTGSIVRKNEVLATFYSSEFLSAGQALIYALSSMDRIPGGGTSMNQAQHDQMQQFNLSLKQYRDSLRNLGMGDRQINEMIRTRKYMENVDIDAPASGLVLVRNVSAGQRFERGKELYRIADLSKVWVLADTYGAEVDQFKPGMRVKISLPNRGKTFFARVSPILPQFDPTGRTLKVRLEVDNPDYLLRPDMYVDVELPFNTPPMLSVPADAVLDSGLKKTVFVEKGTGIFVPREVETGRNIGNRIEILTGLKEGERIAISGTFLLDSESRMKSAASGISGTPQQDPVCGMYVDETKARSKGLMIEAGGKTNFFCSDDCKGKFKKQPAVKPGSGTSKSKAPAVMPAKTEVINPAEHDAHAGHKAAPAASGQMDHSGHDMQGGMK
ncbi:efflux RND transporter periplasmic adaptor subunit [Geobacter pelophilus]|uniref:Efflux RND transporter periplasmic adaptor subunit n=1 Tax=Geoanaerobacter pelophilus TaxID=60036 RepID=A0AAW4LC50_9BACT|nr:efflux RND transporter periplasmic adaptor subunit [Geoanaerobacter pelophilus]MBT0665604.1 efflux RND transporter periplasmic adaptor subunit [Geoanaerobacter pelophilus]